MSLFRNLILVATACLSCYSCISAFSTNQSSRVRESFYDILGVPPTASFQQLKCAYRDKAKYFHPDNNPNDDVSEFLKINRAYEVLSNPKLKKLYDRLGEAGVGTSYASDEREVQEATERHVHSPGRSHFYHGGNGQARSEDVVYSADSFFKRTGTQHTTFPGFDRDGSATGPYCAICGGTGGLEEVVATHFGSFKTRKLCHACNPTQNSAETIIGNHLEYMNYTSDGETGSIKSGKISKANNVQTIPFSQAVDIQEVPKEEDSEDRMRTAIRKDLYTVLGVNRNVDTTFIKQAYEMLSTLYHPDTNPSQIAIEKHREVTQAYKVLGDSNLRRRYDAEDEDFQNDLNGSKHVIKEQTEISARVEKNESYDVLGISPDSDSKTITNTDPSTTVRLNELHCAYASFQEAKIQGDECTQKEGSTCVKDLDKSNNSDKLMPFRLGGNLIWSEQVLFLDLYQVLGISRDSDANAIKNAYIMLEKIYSPGHGTNANEKFQEVNLAFTVLGNDVLRRRYDHFGIHGIVQDNPALESNGINVAVVKQSIEVVEPRVDSDFELDSSPSSGHLSQSELSPDLKVGDVGEVNHSDKGHSSEKESRKRKTKPQQNIYPDMRGQVDLIGPHLKSKKSAEQPQAESFILPAGCWWVGKRPPHKGGLWR